MKKITAVFLILLLTVICFIVPSFAAEAVPVSDEDEILEILQKGGSAVLQNNIQVEAGDNLLMGECRIDLNGHILSIAAESIIASEDICFLNGTVRMIGEDLETGHLSISRKLAVRNGCIILNKEYVKLNRSAGYILAADNSSHVSFSSSDKLTALTTLDIAPEDITDETFFQIVSSGELPEMECEGYRFEGWMKRNGKEFTSWLSHESMILYPAFTSELSGGPTASVFGSGSIWIILTCVFFISTVVLAFVKKKK